MIIPRLKVYGKRAWHPRLRVQSRGLTVRSAHVDIRVKIGAFWVLEGVGPGGIIGFDKASSAAARSADVN